MPVHDVISLGCWVFSGCLISIEFLVKISGIRNRAMEGTWGSFLYF